MKCYYVTPTGTTNDQDTMVSPFQHYFCWKCSRAIFTNRITSFPMIIMIKLCQSFWHCLHLHSWHSLLCHFLYSFLHLRRSILLLYLWLSLLFHFRRSLLLHFRHYLLLYFRLSLLFNFRRSLLYFRRPLLRFQVLFFIFDLLVFIIFYILIFVISNFLIFDALFFILVVRTIFPTLIIGFLKTSNPLVNEME